ncbi:MAG: hypothetical protein GY722_02945 [bacterium]|nr:hypothetical protein [bacterium]
MKDVPYTLKIGPRWFPIKLIEGLSESDPEKVDGKVLYHPEPEIQVDPDQSPFDLYSTMLHEVLHVLDDCYGLQLGERGVLALECSLTSLIQENPGFVQALLENCAKVPGRPLVAGASGFSPGAGGGLRES